MFFDYGFGPFRWVCSSGDPKDLETTDRIATEVLEEMRKTATPDIIGQLDDNIHWIKEAGKNKLVVGSQARILYADSEGRTKIALAFNEAIKRGEISRPVVWVATTTTYQVPTLHSARQATSTTVHSSALIWLFTTLLATLSVAQRGFQSTTVAA